MLGDRMKYCFSLLLIALFVISAFAQDSSKYLKVEKIFFSGKAFQMMKDSTKITEIGGDSVQINKSISYRDSTTTRQIVPTESQLEDRQHNNLDFERTAKVADNQYLSFSFINLSGKEIKSISFQFRLTENGKKFFERNIKATPHLMLNGNFYVSEKFFSTKDLSNQKSIKEIIIKSIQFTDGTKLSF